MRFPPVDYYNVYDVCIHRKEEKRAWKNFYDNPSYFSAHLKDPWLKDNALVSRRLENGEKESLRDINISEFLWVLFGRSFF